MDVLTVREATKFAADWARSGKVKKHFSFNPNVPQDLVVPDLAF